MEPDAALGELQICDEHPGYTNFVAPGQSVPFPRQQIPLESEARVRSFLATTMPQLASRPLSFARICWCADTPDRNFLIDRHPDYEGLVLAVERDWGDVQGRKGGPNRVMDFGEVKSWTDIPPR